LPVLANWNKNSSLETVLVEIRRYVLSCYPSSSSYMIFALAAGRWHRSIIENYLNHPKIPCSELGHYHPYRGTFFSSSYHFVVHNNVSIHLLREFLCLYQIHTQVTNS
jgi:hypothetical protein